MSLNTGGSTSTTTAGNTAGQTIAQDQLKSALSTSGGLGQFAQPSNLFNLTPGEQTFQQGIMGASLPGSMAQQANAYTGPGGMFGNLFTLNPQGQQAQQAGVKGMSLLTDPTFGLFHNYLNQMVNPSVVNNAIASGYGGASGAAQGNMQRADTQAAMQYGSQYPAMVNAAVQNAQLPQTMQLQGLTGLGLPLAQNDYARMQTGMQAAGAQRQLSTQDLNRVQSLLQSLLGLSTSYTPGGTTTTQGPGTAASLTNLAGSALSSLFNGGTAGSAGSLGATGLSALSNYLFGGSGSGLTTSANQAGTSGSSLSDILNSTSPGIDLSTGSSATDSLLSSLSGLGGGDPTGLI